MEQDGDDRETGETYAMIAPTTAAATQANVASDITDEQWRAMMDVVMAIYDYREEEYAPYEFTSDWHMLTDYVHLVATTLRDSSIEASTNDMFPTIMTLSKNPWRSVF
jgi:hypothetical protein